MRRTARSLLLAAVLGAAPFTACPGFAFEAQSGGVPLSAQSVALLANRLASRNDPMAAKGMDPSGSMTAGQQTATGQRTNGPTRDERMMAFMLGGKPGAQPNAKPDALADLKAALQNRR